jgi:uncharacterized coiled-coil protein SlyX
MTQIPGPHSSSIQGAASSSLSSPSSRPAGASALGPEALAFQALLEDLEGRAQSLERTSRQELTPDGLAGALDEARTSLERMLSLKDQLLEAWRASQQTAPPSPRS